MGRGVSYGGGQSSLGYLFGSDEPPKVASDAAPVAAAPPTTIKESPPVSTPEPPAANKGDSPHTHKAEETVINTDIPAGKLGNNQNNYHRAEGQNTGNFITDRPSTKVHSAPGGGSSLGYLFGGDGK